MYDTALNDTMKAENRKQKQLSYVDMKVKLFIGLKV